MYRHTSSRNYLVYNLIIKDDLGRPDASLHDVAGVLMRYLRSLSEVLIACLRLMHRLLVVFCSYSWLVHSYHIYT